MDKIDFVKMTKEDLKNFNAIIVNFKQFKRELLLYKGQEEKFKDKIDMLNYQIIKYQSTIEIIKLSIEVLSPIGQEIIVCSYFEKMILKDIAIRMNVSIEYIVSHKRNALKELSELMYGHLEILNIDTVERLRAKPSKIKRSNPVYQFDINGKFINKWSSAKECNDNHNEFIEDSIRQCCNGKVKTYKGYRWSYVPEINHGTGVI